MVYARTMHKRSTPRSRKMRTKDPCVQRATQRTQRAPGAARKEQRPLRNGLSNRSCTEIKEKAERNWQRAKPNWLDGVRGGDCHRSASPPCAKSTSADRSE